MFGCDRMDDSCRPVKLRKVVLGYPCSDAMSEFRFDLMLSYRLANVVLTYSELKPTLVVSTPLLQFSVIALKLSRELKWEIILATFFAKYTCGNGQS